jgi:hypothetical protein
MTMLYKWSYDLSSLLNRSIPIHSPQWQWLHAALRLIQLLLWTYSSKQVKDKLFPDVDFSSKTVLGH